MDDGRQLRCWRQRRWLERRREQRLSLGGLGLGLGLGLRRLGLGLKGLLLW
jgi:hypothetical protein